MVEAETSNDSQHAATFALGCRGFTAKEES